MSTVQETTEFRKKEVSVMEGEPSRPWLLLVALVLCYPTMSHAASVQYRDGQDLGQNCSVNHTV